MKIILAVALLLAAPAWAQTWPAKPVTVVLPAVAGGPVDVITRSVSDKLRERLGQPFVVENRPGAGGTIGATSVARAAPDGYTLLLSIDPPIVVNPALLEKVPYDPVKDFAPVAMIGDGGDNLLLVPAESPSKSVRELVEAMRKDPSKANYTSSGNGGPGHILGELFKREAKFDAQHVPQKGAPPALNDLMAGRMEFAFLPVGLVRGHIQGGKVRALAVAAAKRNPLVPDLPTVAESGFPGFQPVHWFVVALAPANTPRPIVDRLNAEIRAITATPEFRQLLERQGLVPGTLSPAELGERIRKDYAFWSGVVKQLNIKAD
jgi:tripartite-type tricarboxylate transporter receptor subunit TctC